MSNLSRPFYVVRRRPHLMDILIPKSATTKKYRLLASATFSGTFTQIIEADIASGYVDPAIITSGQIHTLHALNNPGQIRVVFDPQTFAGTAGIADSNLFWLKFQAVDFAGTPGTASNPIMVLAEEQLRGDTAITIAGTAPSGATVANSLQLDLSYRMKEIVIRNEEGSTALYVATEVGGSETKVDGGSTALSQYRVAIGAQACLLVRGGGATAAFSATMTSFLPLR